MYSIFNEYSRIFTAALFVTAKIKQGKQNPQIITKMPSNSGQILVLLQLSGSMFYKSVCCWGKCRDLLLSLKSDWKSLSCVQLSWDPMDYIVHGILQARILEWVAFPFCMGSSQSQGLNPGLLHCRWILYHLSYQGSQSLKSRLADNISRVILSKFLYWCINVVSTYLWVVRCMWFYSCAFCFLNFYSEQIIFFWLKHHKKFKKNLLVYICTFHLRKKQTVEINFMSCFKE